jgi:hypothetical protein
MNDQSASRVSETGVTVCATNNITSCSAQSDKSITVDVIHLELRKAGRCQLDRELTKDFTKF